MRGRLWRNRDFLDLWAGQTVSLLGTAVTMLALPTAAILVLHAGALQVGLLAAAQRIPFPLLALFAGVWVDRVRRRPLMIAADVGRALAVASIPMAAWLGELSLLHLYVVAALLGTLSVVFDVAYLAYLPALVGSEDIVEGNTRLQLSFSVSGLLGPALAGVLVQVAGAARAFLADAVSYVVSVAALLLIRRPEPPPRDRPGTTPVQVRREIGDGLRFVLGHDVLRSLLVTQTAAAAGLYLALPILLLFVYDDLHLSPLAVGAISALEGVGQILGAVTAARCARALGLGRALAALQATCAMTIVAFPLAQITPAVPTVAILLFLLGASAVAQDVNQVSLRQALTPPHLQGRMNATFRACFWGVWPLASMLGGVLASTWGPAQTLMVGGAVALLSSALIVRTSLWRVRAHPGAVGAAPIALPEAAARA